MKLKHGAVLQDGRYRIEKVLGQGGFGITYMAVQIGLNRPVAVKEFFMKEYCNRDADTSFVSVPSAGGKEMVTKFREKFIKEAQTIAALNNPHIVRIFDVFEENGTAYYVMELLEGGSLSGQMSKGGIHYTEAAGYIKQICDALTYIHSQNILHLDIKPSNVLFRVADETVLIDFGISKHYDEYNGSQTSSTPAGMSRGYAPLEQSKAGGIAQFSPATDIYSLGATFYALVTGQTPPDADDVNEDGLPPFPKLVPASIAALIEKAMQPRRKDRPQSIREFMALLDEALRNAEGEGETMVFVENKPQSSEPEKSPEPEVDRTTIVDEPVMKSKKEEKPSSEPQKKSHRWIFLLLLLLFLLLGAGGYMFLKPNGSTDNKVSDSAADSLTLEAAITQEPIVEEDAFLKPVEQKAPARAEVVKPAYEVNTAEEHVYESSLAEEVEEIVITKHEDTPASSVPSEEESVETPPEDLVAEPTENLVAEPAEDLVAEPVPEEVEYEDPIPFQLVEQKPTFQGGDANKFSKWVNQRLVYPELAKENDVQGRVTLQFTVEKDGSITNIKVLRSVDPALDKEAVRVVSMSPRWTPAKDHGRLVRVTYTFPVIFQLR